MADQSRELPRLAPKRILYLDQMAISNLLKSTLPRHRAKFTEDNPATQFGYWPKLLDRLEHLVHLNLLACPRSSIHDLESAFNDRLSGSLRSFHEQLAADVKLGHHEMVQRFQLEAACRGWLSGEAAEPLERGAVVNGTLDGWLDRFIVNAYHPVIPEELEALRANRELLSERWQDSFERWCERGPLAFETLLCEEEAGYGPGLAKQPFSSDVMIGLRAQMEQHGIPQAQWTTQIQAFLHSEAPACTDFARITASMIAALAWRAGRRQLGKPTRGLTADLRAIASYLPYVDAMFLDNECARMLRESPLNESLPYNTQIFSVESRDELFDWLTDVADEAPQGHVELVERVYGPRWLEPRRHDMTRA